MNSINIIGLMSGTSMDGIDGTVLISDGINFERTEINLSIKYSNAVRKILLKIEKDPLLFIKNKTELEKADKLITIDHLKLVKKIIKKSVYKIDIIAFHGQTIYHNFKLKKSIQLGDPQYLADNVKINVVADFRENDLQSGGHGAPLAPIYHQSIIKKTSQTLPTCFINIGGVANLTYWDGKQLIGFDTGPGNGLLDQLIREHTGKDFDYNGMIAAKGKTNKNLLQSFLNHGYFNDAPPKSLDKLFFNEFLSNKHFISLSLQDAASTLSDLTVNSILNALTLLPKFPKQCVLMGGGSKNKNIVNKLKKNNLCKFVVAEEINLSAQYIEAELMAFLASRHINNLSLTFPSTTGVSKPISGGNLYKFK